MGAQPGREAAAERQHAAAAEPAVLAAPKGCHGSAQLAPLPPAGSQVSGRVALPVPVVAAGPGPTSAITPARSLTATFSVRTVSSKRSLRATSDTDATDDKAPANSGVSGVSPL